MSAQEIEWFIRNLREEIAKQLIKQTNWGRNQLELAIEQAINAALLRLYKGTE